MPTTTCNHNGKEIDVQKAIQIRDDEILPEGTFKCIECRSLFAPIKSVLPKV